MRVRVKKVPGHPEQVEEFVENPESWITLRCDEMARKAIEMNQMSMNSTEIVDTENHALWRNGQRSSKSINELIREIDWKNEEGLYTWKNMEKNKNGLTSRLEKCLQAAFHRAC